VVGNSTGIWCMEAQEVAQDPAAPRAASTAEPSAAQESTVLTDTKVPAPYNGRKWPGQLLGFQKDLEKGR